MDKRRRRMAPPALLLRVSAPPREPDLRLRHSLTDHPFLRHAGDQAAVAGEDAAAVEAASAAAPRAVGGIEQPFIGAERAVKPQRMIKRCHLHVRVVVVELPEHCVPIMLQGTKVVLAIGIIAGREIGVAAHLLNHLVCLALILPF